MIRRCQANTGIKAPDRFLQTVLTSGDCSRKIDYLIGRTMYRRASVFRRISDRQLFVDFQIQCSSMLTFLLGGSVCSGSREAWCRCCQLPEYILQLFANNLETFKVKPNRVWQKPQLLQTNLFDIPLLEEWCSLEHSSLYVEKDKVETCAWSEQHKRVVRVSR